MKTYVVARAFSLPLRSRIKPARRKAKGREMKGQLPWRRSGVVKVAFDPEGLPISHLPPEGDFVRRQAGGGCQGSAIYIELSSAVYCRRETRKKNAKQPRKGFKPGIRLEFQRAPYGFPSGGIKTRERFTFELEDMSILVERQTATSRELQQGVYSSEKPGIFRDFFCGNLKKSRNSHGILLGIRKYFFLILPYADNFALIL